MDVIVNHASCFLDENVEKIIGLLLRESGDRLDERVRNNFYRYLKFPLTFSMFL